MSEHLSYAITNWKQATKCLSNNSKDLSIRVAEIRNAPALTGLRISVVSNMLGTLFSTVINSEGFMISDAGEHEMTTSEILVQLAKFGFDIEYQYQTHLPTSQLQYLMTIRDLGFDKIRTIATNSKMWVVCFNISAHPDWLINTYVPRKGEMEEALMNGTAMNLTDVSITRHFNWDWLTFVANIDDIIRDQEN